VPFDTTTCAVEAYGVVRVPVEEIAALRKAPGPSIGTKIPPSLLKHADHQTVLALASVLKASHDFGWSGRSFADWGVIAAPRFLGRIGAASAMYKFTQAGASSVSPLIIPTMSLHAVAGSVSLAIQARGFNYGVGGGPAHLAEALLAGLAARDDGDVPGVWVVATGFDPEPVPDVSGKSLTPSTGFGVALALTPAEPRSCRLNLRLVPTTTAADPTVPPGTDANGGEPLTGLIALADFLTGMPSSPRSKRWWSCVLPGFGAIALDDDPARSAVTTGPPARAVLAR
jgi:hypothetical protein